jgi:hypothetical protein
MALIEKKPRPSQRTKKGSYAFYLSKGLVDDIGKVAKEAGRSKSEVLEILASAGLALHLKEMNK